MPSLLPCLLPSRPHPPARRRAFSSLALLVVLPLASHAMVGPMGPGLFTSPPSALKNPEPQTVEAGQPAAPGGSSTRALYPLPAAKPAFIAT